MTVQPRRRADAVRSEQALLDAAAREFVEHGVQVPVRVVAARAGVGVGTVYRHFPTRADLVTAVYRHQVDACAAAGPALLAEHEDPADALAAWVDLFVDFLVTKHAVPAAGNGGGAIHTLFLDRLVPVCADLLEAGVRAGAVAADVEAYGLMRAVGNLCLEADADARYDARRAVGWLLAGLDGGSSGPDGRTRRG